MATSRGLQGGKFSENWSSLTCAWGYMGISEGLWWTGQMRSHVNQCIWEEGEGGCTWPQFAYRNANYRIIHNLRPIRFWERHNTEAEEILEPQIHSPASPDYRCFRDTCEETEGDALFWADYSSPPLSVHHHKVPDIAG